MAIQSDGKTLVMGGTNWGIGEYLAVARYNMDGSLDSTFGSTGMGKVVTGFGHGRDVAYCDALQADGTIVVPGHVGSAISHTNFAAVRYKSDGSLDRGFGTGGNTATDFAPTFPNYAWGVGIQADGKIVAAGYMYNGSSDDFALARYNP